MEYIVNQQNIQKYAERLTNDLCRQFFINKAFISGPEILKFNGESQLNLLVIKNIYLNWLKETSRLKSIYFDYEDEEVKQALANFMNILSNHIKVYRSDFEVLLQKSIADFILLSAAPQTFFTKECEVLAGPKISLQLLKEFSKYIKVNRFVMDQVIREIEASGYTETFGGETIRFVMKALNENPGKVENPSETLSGLFDQLPARVTEFVAIPKPPVTRPAFLDVPREEYVIPEPRPVAPVATEEVVQQIPEPEQEPTPGLSADNTDQPEMTVENEPVILEEPVAQELDSVVSESALPETSPEIQEEEEPAIFQKLEPIIPEPKQEKPEEELPDPVIQPVFTASQTMEAVQTATQTKVPFKTLVPMHYRFTFINALFGGNQQAWAEAVDKIDAASSSQDAIFRLKADYGQTYNWDKEEDNVGILSNYIERKF